MILDIHPDLFKAWNLKERYMRFDKADLSEQDRSSHLAKLIDDFISSDIPEMMSMGLTLSNWRQEILNTFHTMNKTVTSSDGSRKSITARVTSGPVEGRNKYIKILLKLANGYVNFNRFRNRAMYVLNRSESYSSDKLENGIPHRQK
jgi:transposase